MKELHLFTATDIVLNQKVVVLWGIFAKFCIFQKNTMISLASISSNALPFKGDEVKYSCNMRQCETKCIIMQREKYKRANNLQINFKINSQ